MNNKFIATIKCLKSINHKTPNSESSFNKIASIWNSIESERKNINNVKIKLSSKIKLINKKYLKLKKLANSEGVEDDFKTLYFKS